MNFASRSVIYENPLGSFTYRKAGTWGILFYFPSEGRHTEDTRKIQRFRPGLNLRTRVPVASMLNTRPPKPSKIPGYVGHFLSFLLFYHFPKKSSWILALISEEAMSFSEIFSDKRLIDAPPGLRPIPRVGEV